MITSNSNQHSHGLSGSHLDWLDPLKAIALFAILLNHLVEEFGSGPWFTNPSDDWIDFASRITRIYPEEFPFPYSIVHFMGWLGDSGPGVFILVSGFALTWGALTKGEQSTSAIRFYKHRLVRIFPLYIATHLLILAACLIIPNSKYNFEFPLVLLSLLGLRFSDDLFFYINPSWWFIWLILQLYLIYPFLLKAQKKLGVKTFLVTTLAFTFGSRLAGLFGLGYSDNLYFWMTGIFFGTRLAEFSVGMAAAVWYLESQKCGKELPSTGTILGWSTLIYASGLGCSLTWYGAIVSNLMVTIGLCGMFYVIWQTVSRRSYMLARAITWVGVESYSVFLLHQVPLQWTSAITDFYLHLIFALCVIGLSFPAGFMISWCVRQVQGRISNAMSFVEF
jgi:peptidoglycan/LPS O-acetylase OafA/YrhL